MRRRDAIRATLTAAAAVALAPRALAAQRFRLGYAAITWGGDDRQAIADIASLGFKGIQLRASAVEAFGTRPEELKALLSGHGLALVALSSGELSLDRKRADAEFGQHVQNARFVRAVGGAYLQVIDERPKGAIRQDYFSELGRRLTDLGKRTADVGIPLGYHHHMGSLGETPEAIDRILDAADPRYVQLILDTAHYLQGGGDPIQALQHYGRSLLFVHLKDVADAKGAPQGYRFVELGQGRLDVPAVVKELDSVGFSGWVIVELDAATSPRTARDSAEANRRELVDTLGLAL